MLQENRLMRMGRYDPTRLNPANGPVNIYVEDMSRNEWAGLVGVKGIQDRFYRRSELHAHHSALHPTFRNNTFANILKRKVGA